MKNSKKMEKLIIDIPRETKEQIIALTNVGASFPPKLQENIVRAIINGTPLDDIKAEIEEKYGNCDICEYFEDYDYEENDISEYRPIGNIADVLQIIDKYRNSEVIE